MDALGQFANSRNQKTIFMPLEASSGIGAIGGITKLVGELNDDDKSGSSAGSGIPSTNK